jgi:TnpA family transposase
MSRRHIFTERQRAALFDLPTDELSLLKFYTLGDDDLENIRQRRRPENRIGFALQLCALRYPGRALAPGEMIPREVLSFVGAQLEFRLMRFSLMPHGAKPVSSTWTRCAKFTATRPSRAVVPVICGSGLSARPKMPDQTRILLIVLLCGVGKLPPFCPQYRQSSACARMLWSPLSGGLKRGLRKI